MATTPWQEVASKPEYQALSLQEQAQAKIQYFNENVRPHVPETDLPGVRQQFFSEANALDTSLEAKHPTLSAIGKTIMDIPAGIKQAGEAVMSGATLGISDKIKQGAESLATALIPTPAGQQPPAQEEPVIRPWMKTAGSFAGAVAPISTVGKTIAAPIIKAAYESKYAAPFARMLGWGTAGAAYTGAEEAIKKEDFPSAEDMATQGALWAGMEGVLSATGWTGRLALAVNRLSKTWELPRAEVLKTVIQEANLRDMPIAQYAKNKVDVQKALKEMATAPTEGAMPKINPVDDAAREFVEKVESLVEAQKPRGSYWDVANQLGHEERLTQQPTQSLIKATDTFSRPPYNTTIEAERAAQPKMFEGSTEKVPLEELNPDLAARADQFMARGIAPDKTTFSDSTLRAPAGMVAGVEVDENGDLAYDFKKGLAGTVAVGAGLSVFGKKLGKGVSRLDEIGAKLPAGSSEAKVHQMFADTTSKSKEMGRFTFEKAKDAFVNGWIDVSGNLKSTALKIDPKIGKEVVMNRELLAGAVPKAAALIDDYRGQIFKGLDATEQQALNRVIQGRRTIAIDAYRSDVKHPGGLTGQDHQAYLDALKREDPAMFGKVSKAADSYFNAMNEQLSALKDEGIITAEQFDSLSRHEYSPRQFLQHLDSEQSFSFGGKKITVPDSGIKSLDKGSEEFLHNNAETLLQEVVVRTQGRIFRNRANKSLWDLAEAVPDNLLVRPAKIQGYTKDGVPVFADAPAGHEKISVMIDGEKKEMVLPANMAEEWVKSDPLINQTMGNVVGWLSGGKVLKSVATGYNPGFALSNIPRDIGLIWSANKEYSSHLPVALAQLGKDLLQVAPDVIRRKGAVRDYINEGGGMQLLTYYGRFSGKGYIGEQLNSIGNVMGWVGETSELWTRMALRNRALANGATPQEASWIARRYLDFSQGGNIAKGLDTGLPYFNAAIQGTRGLLRGARRDPAVFTYKMAQLGTVAASLYMANYTVNPECWRQITDREKEANFIITTPFSYTDDKGEKRYLYGKIAKDQGQRVVTTLFEGAMARYYEGKFPTKQQLMGIEDFAILPNPTKIPAVAAILSYAGNKDTWTMEDVWRGPKVEPKEEYRDNTGKVWVGAGELTGLSPERAKAAAGKIIPGNNPFVALVGGGLKMITGELQEDVKGKIMTQILTENPTIRRVFASTNSYTPYKEDVEKIKEAEASRRFRQQRDLDRMADEYFKTNDPAAAEQISRFIEQQPETDQDRLVDLVITTKQLFHIPDRRWWVTLKGMSPEIRAAAFHNRLEKESEEEKAKLLETAGQIDGFVTDKFIDGIVAIKAGKKQVR